MQKTRQRILTYLNENHQTTAVELARLLDQTAANIRHHLAILEERGLIQAIGQAEPDGRGRPITIYRATANAQPDGIANLAAALLENIRADRNAASRRTRLKNAALALRGNWEMPNGATQRLTTAAQRLTELNYQAHWEARAAGPQMILGRCPYAAILPDHPELCSMDTTLISAMTGGTVELVERFSGSLDGPKVCRFKIT
jgi:predicted ArsR family transcriptional regulator